MSSRTFYLPQMEYHSKDNFKEQIFSLRKIGFWTAPSSGMDYFKFLRSHWKSCQPGSASFDPSFPGIDSWMSWKKMDDLIEKEDVCGFFHTHPNNSSAFAPSRPAAVSFSEQDWILIRTLAMTYGERPLWHGVQAAGCESSRFVCVQYINGKILVYKYALIYDNLTDPTILLPQPDFYHGKQICQFNDVIQVNKL